MIDTASIPFYASDEFVPHNSETDDPRQASPEPQRSRPTVLVVDDQRLIVDTITEILAGAGFEVIPAYDSSEALEAAGRLQPDYLLTDVLMPGMNGVELAIAVRKMYPAVKITLFSGQAGISEMLLEAQTRGYQFDFIAKPIHPVNLVARLKDQA